MIVETICECEVVYLPMDCKVQQDIFKVKLGVRDHEVIPPQNAIVELSQQLDNVLEIRTQIDVNLGPYEDQLKKGSAFLRKTAKIFGVNT